MFQISYKLNRHQFYPELPLLMGVVPVICLFGVIIIRFYHNKFLHQTPSKVVFWYKPPVSRHRVQQKCCLIAQDQWNQLLGYHILTKIIIKLSDRQATFPQFTSNSILVKRGVNRPNCLGLLNLSNSSPNGKVILFLVFNSPWDTPGTEKMYLWEVFTYGKWQSEGFTVYSTTYIQK